MFWRQCMFSHKRLFTAAAEMKGSEGETKRSRSREGQYTWQDLKLIQHFITIGGAENPRERGDSGT